MILVYQLMLTILGIFRDIYLLLVKKYSTIYQMATPDVAEMSGLETSRPPLPSERWPEYFAYSDRVLAVFFQSHMEKPKLIIGEVSDSYVTPNPRPGDPLGMVHLRTPKTDDNRTGRFIGVDMSSVGLITEDALTHLHDEDFRAEWLADGSEAWAGEAYALEQLLEEGIADGSIGRRIPEPGQAPAHPARTLGHVTRIPGLNSGKVGVRPPVYV
jgi:hypothetical protein